MGQSKYLCVSDLSFIFTSTSAKLRIWFSVLLFLMLLDVVRGI